MDLSFIIPRLITEIILPGIDGILSRKYLHVSYSRITPVSNPAQPLIVLKIERLSETLTSGIEIIGGSEDDIRIIIRALEESARETQFILQVISGKEIKGVSISEKKKYLNINNLYQFIIGLRKDDKEIILNITIPGRFFNILIPSLDTSRQYDNITELLIPFFKKSDILCPSIGILLEKLESNELSWLLDLLKKNNRLTDYQLVLLLNGFPEFSLKIKNALSKNGQKSLREELKKYKGKVTREDIACGIYSVEEGISRIFKKEKNFIADHFRLLSSLIKKITDYELCTRKSWEEWIAEMGKSNLLYKTLLKCTDRILRDAFTDYSEERYPFFNKYFPAPRIKEIFGSASGRLSGTLTEARASVIKNFRDLTAESFRYDHADFVYILASVRNGKDYDIIVRNTGWYILSTALKQCSVKIVDRVISGIRYPASSLVKGVISGTINPDIIHDDIQINRARNESVRVIFELYKDGIIELDF